MDGPPKSVSKAIQLLFIMIDASVSNLHVEQGTEMEEEIIPHEQVVLSVHSLP